MCLRRKLLISAIVLCLAGISYGIFILPSQYTVPILIYHHISQPVSNDERLYVSPVNFKKQMDFLAKNKYRVISLEELINLIKSQKPLPHHLVVITFDDGYEDNYIYAYRRLKEHNFPAAIFIITNYIGREEYLRWPEIEEMSNNNIEIGSHTKSHPYLPDLKNETMLQEEVFGSKKFIEAKLKRPVKFFCYPFGGINNLAKQIVIKSGYLGACATHPGARYAKYDAYALRRIKISPTDNLFTFRIKTSGYYTLFKSRK